MTLELVDLSHSIHDGMVTYPGLPAPSIGTHLSREDSRAIYGGLAEFHIGMINMCTNTGTYLDVPFHRYAEGYDLAGLELERVADVDAVCLHIDHCTPSVLGELILDGRALLVRTDWSLLWGSDAYRDPHGPAQQPPNPTFLTAEVAHALVDAGVACVGIDSVNIDSMQDRARPVHTILLGAGIPIVEHLTNLDRLPDAGFSFSAVPPKVEGLGTFTVRAYATIVR